jgi:transposase
MWIPPEDVDPIVLQEPTRKNIGVFGAVRINDGRLVTKISKPFNAVTFQDYLELLLNFKKDGHCMHIILDNSRYHHAILLNPWLEKHSEEIFLEFLPPYSPDLNPIERVWKLTRKLRTHNRYFPTIEDILDSVNDQFEIWQQPNSVLKTLCAIN